MAEIKVKLTTDPRNRADVLESLSARLGDLPLETAYTVNVDALQENRRVHQNALMWVWNAQCAEFYDNKISTQLMHGRNKKNVLVELMLGWDKHRDTALFFRKVAEHIADPVALDWFADRSLRTKELTVKEFAAYLSGLQFYWAEQGLVLTTLHESYDRAIGKAA